MQNPILPFKQSSFISEKPSFLFEKLKKFDELQRPESLIFFAETLHTSYVLPMSTKECSRFFLFCFDPYLLINLVSVKV